MKSDPPSSERTGLWRGNHAEVGKETEGKTLNSDSGMRKSENKQRTEDRGQMADGRGRSFEFGSGNAKVSLSELKFAVLKALHQYTEEELTHADVTMIALETS